MMNACAGPDRPRPVLAPRRRRRLREGPRSAKLKGLRVAYSDTLGFAPAVDPEVRAGDREGRRVELRKPSAAVSTASIPGGRRPTTAGGRSSRRHRDAPGPVSRSPGRDRPGARAHRRGGARVFADEVRAGVVRDRLAWAEHARAFFEKYDLLLSPTCANRGLQDRHPLRERDRRSKRSRREASSAFTFPFNMTGQPSASVPCGFTRDGLPIGLQITGRRFEDVTVLHASAAFEAARPWADRRPAIG